MAVPGLSVARRMAVCALLGLLMSMFAVVDGTSSSRATNSWRSAATALPVLRVE